MYSPKIKEEYIPVIYKLAKIKGIKMTTLVNQIIGFALKQAQNDLKQFLQEDAKEIR